jgi:hypothetical protein
MPTAPFSPFEWALYAVITAVCLGLMINTSLYYQRHINCARVPFQWCRDGTPKKFTSKTFAVWFHPAVMSIFAVFMLSVAISSADSQRMLSTIFVFTGIGMMSAQPIHGVAVMQWIRLRDAEDGAAKSALT